MLKESSSVFKPKNKLFWIFITGLFIRLLLISFTSHPASWERITSEDSRFILGIDPTLVDPGVGTSFRLFFAAVYVPYLIFNIFGIHYTFLLVSLFKVPSIVGDIIILYSLYNIALLVSKDRRKGLSIATAYFLNPYVIWLTSIVGHAEQLMVGFILLALLYLLKGKTTHSAISLSIATFSRFISILILPYFLVSLWRADKSISPRLTRYFAGFLISSAVLSIPYLIIFVQLYSSSKSAFWSYITNSFLPTVGEPGLPGPLPTGFRFNFTGFLASLGIWPTLSTFLNYRVFILLYLIATVVMLKRGYPSPQSMSRYIVVVFSLFMVIVPLNQSHYLMWIFPFLLIESIVFLSIPRYYLHVLWISNVVAETLISGHFTTYFPYFSIFPATWEYPWAFFNQLLIHSTSVLHGSFLLLTVISCLTFGYARKPSIKGNASSKKNGVTLKMQ